MEQHKIENIKVIGRCVNTQTVSLDMEIELWDGIPYDINFFQDFSRLCLNGMWVTDIPVPEIIQAIAARSDDVSERPAANCPSWKERQRSQEFCEEVDWIIKKMMKKEEKQSRKHHKGKSIKEAERDFERILERLIGGDCCE